MISDSVYEQLAKDISGLVFNEPLAKHSTIRVGGPANAFVVVKTVEELVKAISSARNLGVSIHILGGGSNTLFSDTGFAGLVIKNMASRITIGESSEELSEEDYLLGNAEVRHEAANPGKYVSFLDLNYEERPGDILTAVESGANLTATIVRTLDANLLGLEWFGGIPGVIGGAIYNNIHGGTHFIGSRVKAVNVLTQDGQRKRYPNEELKLAYDFSRFHDSEEVILTVDFMLTKATNEETERAEYTFREWVKRKSQMQPKIGSLGSTFQNISQEVRTQIGAPTTSAGWLIDQCGLKGHQIGQAMIAREHANFMINLGGAKASDVFGLIQLARRKVKQKFGLDLKTEIFLVGNFPNGH